MPLVRLIPQPTVAMEAVVVAGHASHQVRFALAAGQLQGQKRWNPRGRIVSCGGGVQRTRTLIARGTGSARSVDAGGGGEGYGYGNGSGGDRFGRGGGKGGGGSGSDGSDSSDGDDEERRKPGEAASGALAWYIDQTNRYPVSTKAITAAILNLLGDVFCQVVIDRSEKFDIKRSAVITLLGFFVVGPTLHAWYLALSKVVTVTGIPGAAIRLVLDQFVFSPSFVTLFFALLLTLEGRPKDIVPKIKQDLKPTIIANWKLWIPFQFVNFLLVPQQMQVAFSNLVGLIWNIYLSFASHKAVVLAIPSATVDIEMSPLEGEK